jgi:hypothetical protein
MPDEFLDWSEETRQKSQEAMVRIKAGIASGKIAAQLGIPDRAVKQMELIYRTTQNISISDLLTQLNMKEGDIPQLKKEYFVARGKVLWTRTIGALSKEELRYLEYSSEIAAGTIKPTPEDMVKHFGMSGVPALNQFMKKLTEIVTSDQLKLLDELSKEGDPQLQASIEQSRARVSSVQQIVNPVKSSGLDWSEAMKANCFEMSVWLSVGVPIADMSAHFGVPEAEVQRLNLVALHDAQQSIDALCAELKIDPKQILEVKREILLMRHKSLLKVSGAEISSRDDFYLERLANEGVNIRGAANLFTMNDPTDVEYETFERKFALLSMVESIKLLQAMKLKASGALLEQIEQREAALRQRFEQFQSLVMAAGPVVAKDDEHSPQAGQRRESMLEVASALKDLDEAKGPLDKLAKVAALFKATKKAEKLDEES